MLIRDELIKDLKLLLKLTQPGDGDDTLKVHLKNVAYELSTDFDSLTTQQATLIADADGVITFPDNVQSVKSLWVGDTEIQPIDFQDFQRYTQIGIYNDVVRIQERAGNWIGTLSGAAAASGTNLTLIYKAAYDDIGAFPEYYRRAIMLLAAQDYFIYEDGPDEMVRRIQIAAVRAKEKMQEMQTHNTHKQVRRKSQFELDWNRALRSLVYSNARDVG